MTLFPSAEFATSKSGRQDDTVLLLHTAPPRLWLNSIVEASMNRPMVTGNLFLVRGVEFAKVLALPCTFAQTSDLVPHQLRRGGASADAVAAVADTVFLERGRLNALRSEQRHIRQGRHVRQSDKLSHAQLSQSEVSERYIKENLARMLRLIFP